jgi:hypothetical protein
MDDCVLKKDLRQDRTNSATIVVLASFLFLDLIWRYSILTQCVPPDASPSDRVVIRRCLRCFIIAALRAIFPPQ